MFLIASETASFNCFSDVSYGNINVGYYYYVFSNSSSYADKGCYESPVNWISAGGHTTWALSFSAM